MAVHGRRACGQRLRHLHIRFFYVTDQVEQGWMKVRHCPTGEMVADFFTKPLQGAQFRKLRARIMNCPVDLPPEPMAAGKGTTTAPAQRPQECVGNERGPQGPAPGPKGAPRPQAVPRGRTERPRATSPTGVAEWRPEVEGNPGHAGRNCLPKIPEGDERPRRRPGRRRTTGRPLAAGRVAQAA